MEILVSFRIMGENLIPEEITNSLGIEPAVSHLKGEPHIDKSGRKYANYKMGIWSIDSTLEKTKTLDEHLSDVFNRLKTKETIVRQYLNYEFEIDKNC